jgi:alpha-glucosidase
VPRILSSPTRPAAIFSFSAFALLLGAFAAAAGGPRATRSGEALRLSIGGDTLLLSVLAPAILEIDFEPQGRSSPETEVLAGRERPALGVAMDLDSDPMTIFTSSMRVEVRKADASVSIYDARGRLLLAGGASGGPGAGCLSFSHAAGERFYGVSGFEANALSTQGILRQGAIAVKAGKQGYCGGPLAWTTDGYGLLVDSDGGRFELDDSSISFSGCSKANLECFAIVGTPEEILSGVATLSGHAPMLPKWAMGFMNSQWGCDQRELEDIVATYRAKAIPLDCFILDFDWKDWGGDRYGEWNWNLAKFPDGPSGKLASDLGEQGVKLVGIMKPRIRVDGEQGDYASAHGFWLPARAPYRDYFSGKTVDDLDFSIPECRSWFWQRFEGAFDSGLVGWWNDEADGFNDVEFMDMARSLYEGQRSYSGRRVFSLDRNFYLGSQRYAYALWSGDIKTGFDSMAAQRERMLSAVDLGEAQWGMDSGGFNGTPSPENYARWIEFSAFTPIFRVHGTNGEKRQPWRYGAVAEAAAAAAIRLRYSLLPYIYSYERRATEEGIGLVEPLCLKWPSDRELDNYREAWLFGDYLLVSPVVEAGQTSKSVYLPEGRWLDYWTGEAHDGGGRINLALDSAGYADIPLFIREGAIIPSQEPQDFVGQRAAAMVDLDVFPSASETSFSYYDDDGASYGYERGDYYAQDIRAIRDGASERLLLGRPAGEFVPALKNFLCRIHGLAASSALLDGRGLPRAASVEALSGGTESAWYPGRDKYGDVACVLVPAGREAILVLR